MTCLEVRERLAEQALGVLPRPESREVQRHLEWCAGCRKESDEMLDGLATVALALPSPEPRPSLELRVVERVQAAAGRRPHTGSRRSIRVLAVATLAAVLVSLGTVGWAVSQRNQAQDVNRSLLNKVQSLERLFGTSSGSFQVTLLPTNADTGTSAQDEGRAIIYSSKNRSLILVDVYLAQPSAGPYRFQLFDAGGRALAGGTLLLTTNKDLIFYDTTGQDLAKGISLAVFDRAGRMILDGPVRPGSAG